MNISLLFLSFLFAITITASTYFLLIRKKEKATISSRMESVLEASSPRNIKADAKANYNYEKTMSLEDSYKSKFSRMLFLADMRRNKHKQMFKLIQLSAFILPGFLIFGNLLGNNLTSKSLMHALIVGAGLYFGAFIYLKGKVSKRKSALLRSMPTFFDLLVITLEAGVNFTGALPRILRELPQNDPLTLEFNLMNNEYLAGISFKDACTRLTQRCDVDDLSVIMQSLVEAEQLGASLAGTLRIEADQLRHKIRMKMKERANKIPVKLIMPMMMIFTTMFVIVFGPLGAKLFGSLSEAFPDAKGKNSSLLSDK